MCFLYFNRSKFNSKNDNDRNKEHPAIICDPFLGARVLSLSARCPVNPTLLEHTTFPKECKILRFARA